MAAPGFCRMFLSYMRFLVSWTLQLIFLRILGVFSPTKQRQILVKVAKATQFWDCPLEFDDYADTFLSLKAYLDVCWAIWYDVTSTVRVGSRAPGCDVIELDTGKTRNLLEYENPVFFICLVSLSSFLTQVYLAEAHPPGGWAFKNNINIPRHRSVQERLAAARILQQHDDHVPCTIVADTMDNAVARTYACYPDRLFVILDGRVTYRGGLGPEGYHLDEVRDWLQNFTGICRQD
ncbi:DIO1 [Branchiostoma lanceolatum]|uniref:Iodothyronine deiodinase n=1 Tax=Branchiostoma lanceolatum TaxID=7740 RepID=A0A8J9YYD1_BRALA|nr:DIO1 [Branchiostoma lanceolatum]